MVKVYKCHNFKSQSIIPVDFEPVSIFAFRDKIFIATQNCCIYVYHVGPSQNQQQTNSFATEARVHQLLFNHACNYVATLEVKPARRQIFYAVKVYINWQLATGQNKVRSCVRLANHDHSLKLSSIADDQLQVVDIPCMQKVTCISTCQKTGNLVIVQRDTTVIHQVVEKSVVNSDKTYLDIVPFLELRWSFEVKSISLCEDYIAVISDEETQVVKIFYSDSSKQADEPEIINTKHFNSRIRRKVSSVLSNISVDSDKHKRLDSAQSHRYSHLSSSRNSMNPSPALSNSSLSKLGLDAFNKIEDDDSFVQWKFDDTDIRNEFESGSFSMRRQQQKKTAKTIILKGLQDLSQGDILLADIPQSKDLRGGDHATSGELNIVTVLYRRTSATGEAWKFIQLVPTYILNSERIRDVYRDVPVHSASYSGLVGMSCFLSTVTSGHMYNLWMKTCEISSYKYTSDAIQMNTDGNLLYILHSKGLEIYTCRCHTAAIHNMEDINGITKAYPSPLLETCLLGSHPFIGAAEFQVADHIVALLSKVEDSLDIEEDSIWSLYALEKHSVAEFYKDMVNFGSKSQKNSPETYHHMLQESHTMVRNSLIGVEDTHLQELYRESCALLGEYFSLPDVEDYQLCTPYYLLSGLSIIDVIRQAIQYKQHSKKTTPYCYGKGFCHYLNYVMFQDEEPFVITEAEGDMILEVCAEVLPDKVSDVILFSRVQNYTPETAKKLLQSCMQQRSSLDDKHDAVDMLALACLHLKLCDPEPAQVALNSIPQREITKICIQHHQLLHQDFTELSHLSQLMRCHCPNTLIKALVALHDTGMISLDLAIQLLQGTQNQEGNYKNSHIKDYLEMILEDPQRKYIYDEAAAQLCEIYLKRILNWQPPADRQRTNAAVQMKFAGYFGKRYSWLDNLPPFTGTSPMKQPCLYLRTASPTTARKSNMASNPQLDKKSVCPCSQCNIDLMKLQSMLCSEHTTDLLIDKTLAVLESDNHMQGHDSLWLLCKIKKDKKDTFKKVVECFPSVILDFGISVLNEDKHLWESLLNEVVMMNKIQAQKPDQNAEIYFNAFQGILKYLADILDVRDFIQILPDDGNMMFFLPFITQCQEKQQSRQLLKSIVNKGDRLKLYL